MAARISTLDFALPEPPADADNAAAAVHWHGLVMQHERFSLEAAAKCGAVLILVRDELANRKVRGGSLFTKWVNEHLPFSLETARRYMELAEGWDELSRACESSIEPLSLRAALRELSGEQEEDEEDDEPPTLADAQSILRKSFEKVYESWPAPHLSLMAAQLRELADELEERLHGDG